MEGSVHRQFFLDWFGFNAKKNVILPVCYKRHVWRCTIVIFWEKWGHLFVQQELDRFLIVPLAGERVEQVRFLVSGNVGNTLVRSPSRPAWRTSPDLRELFRCGNCNYL